jgi:hypothetical protein
MIGELFFYSFERHSGELVQSLFFAIFPPQT